MLNIYCMAIMWMVVFLLSGVSSGCLARRESELYKRRAGEAWRLTK